MPSPRKRGEGASKRAADAVLCSRSPRHTISLRTFAGSHDRTTPNNGRRTPQCCCPAVARVPGGGFRCSFGRRCERADTPSVLVTRGRHIRSGAALAALVSRRRGDHLGHSLLDLRIKEWIIEIMG